MVGVVMVMDTWSGIRNERAA